MTPPTPPAPHAQTLDELANNFGSGNPTFNGFTAGPDSNRQRAYEACRAGAAALRDAEAQLAHASQVAMLNRRAYLDEQDAYDNMLAALGKLLGASTAEELYQLELGLRLAQGSAEDTAAALDAIAAMRAALDRKKAR